VRRKLGRGATPLMEPKLLGVLLAGLAIRLLLMPRVGYGPDIGFWKSWLTYSTEFGIANVYALQMPGQTYPPVLLYMLWLLGRLYLVFWPAADSAWLTAFVKVPAVAADLVAALLLARVARRHGSGLSPVRAASLIALNPVWIWLSAYWGQVDILHGGLVAGAWYAALAGSSGIGGALLAIASLTKPQGLIVLPAAAMLIARRSGTRGLLRAVAVGSACAIVICLPFLVKGFGGRLVEIYARAGNVYPVLSLNAFNPWWIATVLMGGGGGRPFPSDAGAVIGAVTPHTIGLVLFLAATVWIVVRCARRPEGSRAWRLLTLQWLAFFLLPTQVHERYLAPALVSLAVAAVIDRRARILHLLLSLAVLLNLLYVVPGAAWISNVVKIVTIDGVLVALGLCAIAVLLVRDEIRDGRIGAR
jgi:hypothetical protein